MKTKRRGSAIFAIVDLNDCRAQDVAGVKVGQRHAGHDFMRFLVGHSLDPFDHPLDVDQFEERLGGLVVGITKVGVAPSSR